MGQRRLPSPRLGVYVGCLFDNSTVSCLRLLRLTTCDGGCGHGDQVDKLTHYVIALCGVHYYASIDK